MNVPQIGYPLALDPVDGLVLVEQDSPSELLGCAKAILDCPLGFLDSDEDSTFGTPQLWGIAEPITATAQRARTAIERSEPRIGADTVGQWTDLVSGLITATLERASG